MSRRPVVTSTGLSHSAPLRRELDHGSQVSAPGTRSGATSDCTTAGSACVTENQTNYCFLVCASKTDCNLHREPENEASCTSSVTFVDGTMNRKVCTPPR